MDTDTRRELYERQIKSKHKTVDGFLRITFAQRRRLVKKQNRELKRAGYASITDYWEKNPQ